jgi:hypothetical protein
MLSADGIEDLSVHWREAKASCIDDAEKRRDGAASAPGDKVCIDREGWASGGSGGNVNSGAERTRSEKKLNISGVDVCRRL